MSKFRKKPVVVEAIQWFKNGDHPDDYPVLMDRREALEHGPEGDVVRYYRDPSVDGQLVCKMCHQTMHEHGWIDTLEGGHIVCREDWIITGVSVERYPCKPEIFEATYDPVEDHPDE